MARPGVELPKAALRVCANIVTGDDAQAQAVVDAGALPVMRELLKQPDKAIRKECCWALSSVMAGTEEQLQEIVKADVFGQVTKLLAIEGPAIQKEAAWCIINSVSGGNTAQIKYFVEHGAIKALCDLLVRTDLMGPGQPLEALEYVLKHGKHAGESYMALVDIFKLKQLGEHADPEVRKRAIRILDMVVNAAPFFGGESNVFVPRGLLTDKTEVSSRDTNPNPNPSPSPSPSPSPNPDTGPNPAPTPAPAPTPCPFPYPCPYPYPCPCPCPYPYPYPYPCPFPLAFYHPNPFA